MRQLTVLLLGDASVGKTTFIQTYKNKLYPSAPPPPTEQFCSYRIRNSINGNPVGWTLWDSPPQSDFGRLIASLQPDLIILCYAVDDVESFRSIPFWSETASMAFPKTPRMIMGLKAELRSSNCPPLIMGNKRAGRNPDIVEFKKVVVMAVELRIRRWVECSARDASYSGVFEAALETIDRKHGRFRLCPLQ